MSRPYKPDGHKRKGSISRILAFDLETTHLKGNFGNILVACAKWVGDKDFALSVRIDQQKPYGKTPASYCDDRFIVQQLVELIDQAQATLAHYGERFDQPFLTTRALVHGLQPPAPVKLIDTWRYAYKKLALTSNRLESLANAFNTNHLKQKLPMEVWQLAAHGDKGTLKKMQAYCENDVDTLVDVYLRMRPVISDHPNVTGASTRKGADIACRICDKEPRRIQARGHRMTKMFRIQRFQCQQCGSYFDGKQEKI